jgi:hypothetical protein
MKNSILYVRLLTAGAFLCVPISLGFTAETNPASADTTASQTAVNTGATAATQAAPARLPYGADDVLKLNRAQISEDIIVNYIQNSGTIYNLGPKDIVYLKSEGVSDRVVNAMLDQRKVAAQASTTAAQPATPVAAAAPVGLDASVAVAPPTYGQPAPVYQPAPEPEPVPARSTLYVIPYPQNYVSYGYYGYYGAYGYPYRYYSPYRYCGPVVSCAVRFGGHTHVHSGFHRH